MSMNKVFGFEHLTVEDLDNLSKDGCQIYINDGKICDIVKGHE